MIERDTELQTTSEPAIAYSTCYRLPFLSLFHADCMEIMKQYPDKYFDLAIVDPPYGLQATGNLSRMNGAGKLKNRAINKFNCDFDLELPSAEYFSELFRVSKNQIIWGGNYFDLPPTRGVICWDKVQPWENFSAWEMAWTSFDKPASLFKFDNRTGDKIHPTQKPVALYEWLLSKYAKAGDTILDTHIGSGSIAIACQTLGYSLTGCELNKSYFQSSVKRIEANAQQASLFETEQPKQEQMTLEGA